VRAQVRHQAQGQPVRVRRDRHPGDVAERRVHHPGEPQLQQERQPKGLVRAPLRARPEHQPHLQVRRRHHALLRREAQDPVAQLLHQGQEHEHVRGRGISQHQPRQPYDRGVQAKGQVCERRHREDPDRHQHRQLGHLQQVQRHEADQPGRCGQGRPHSVAPQARLQHQQRQRRLATRLLAQAAAAACTPGKQQLLLQPVCEQQQPESAAETELTLRAVLAAQCERDCVDQDDQDD